MKKIFFPMGIESRRVYVNLQRTVVPPPSNPPSNPKANATAEIAKQILLRKGEAMTLEAILPLARSVRSWKASGDDKKDKARLYAAMYRATEVFEKTDEGWALLEKTA